MNTWDCIHHITQDISPKSKWLVVTGKGDTPKIYTWCRWLVGDGFNGMKRLDSKVWGAPARMYPNNYIPWAPKTMKNKGFGHLTKTSKTSRYWGAHCINYTTWKKFCKHPLFQQLGSRAFDFFQNNLKIFHQCSTNFHQRKWPSFQASPAWMSR